MMNSLTRKEEYDEVRSRVNKRKEIEDRKYSKAGVCDDYTCTETRKRKGEVDLQRDIERLTSEVWYD